jgi:hypothetical protein
MVAAAGMPRVLVWRALVRAAVRDPTEIGVEGDGRAGTELHALADVLASVPPVPDGEVRAVPDGEVRAGGDLAGPDVEPPPPSADVLVGALRSVATNARPDLVPPGGGPSPPGPPPGGGPSPLDAAWEDFVKQPQLQDYFIRAEKIPVRCSESSVSVAGKDVTAIKTRFETNVEFDAFKEYPDPRSWPRCCIYFTGMTPLGDDPASDSWSAMFCEEVEFIEGRRMHTPLEFLYNVDSSLNVGDLWCTYNLVAPTDWVDVDQGYVRVTKAIDAYGSDSTVITTFKAIRFVDPVFQDWTTLACDTFWGELSVDMAMHCSTA